MFSKQYEIRIMLERSNYAGELVSTKTGRNRSASN